MILVLVCGAALADDAQLRKSLTTVIPEAKIGEIKPSAIPGLYEVTVDMRTVYVTADGRYLLVGDLIDVAQRANLSEVKRKKLVAAAIDAVGEKNMIVMGPKTAKRTITVFTDVDCPYCAKLHLDVPALNAGGVKVRYLLYPRNGMESETWQRSVSVWCASDRVKAVGIAKAGGKVETRTCTNPVKRHYELGQSIGINGTPTIVLDDGEVLPGYVPPPALLHGLGLQAATKP
jgi:thiol:disulfide interchange protein DsbC